ncbi:hypothetical protein ADIARSV_2673 [Arcticibacter svalbardensis MN12-7]|uniref:Uncharacterized protein n=1 Tax=Arcticibacter svalbardensis MN12-7 TaxID=1150600 RepID=R9GR74_9SPHI|nr:hypothetical protein ADIARSV_2673 [Arcticibacter svalbardensis MN12-7]
MFNCFSSLPEAFTVTVVCCIGLSLFCFLIKRLQTGKLEAFLLFNYLE